MNGPCPPWCDKHYPGAVESHTTARWVGPISIMLLQDSDRQFPRLAVGGALMKLSEAQLMQRVMSSLGHDDIAAAIAELAGLAAQVAPA